MYACCMYCNIPVDALRRLFRRYKITIISMYYTMNRRWLSIVAMCKYNNTQSSLKSVWSLEVPEVVKKPPMQKNVRSHSNSSPKIVFEILKYFGIFYRFQLQTKKNYAKVALKWWKKQNFSFKNCYEIPKNMYPTPKLDQNHFEIFQNCKNFSASEIGVIWRNSGVTFWHGLWQLII